MAFLWDIPDSTDQLSTSQADILNNFTILGAIAGNTSAASSSINATSGFNWVYLPANGSNPPAGSAFPATQVALYGALNSTTSTNEIFINKTNQSTVVQVPATASILSTTSSPSIGSGGWTYLPSGIILKFGTATGLTGSATVTVASGGAVPVFNQILTVLLTPYNTTAGDQNFSVRLVSINNTTQFTVYVSPRTTTGSATGGISYVAIGY